MTAIAIGVIAVICCCIWAAAALFGSSLGRSLAGGHLPGCPVDHWGVCRVRDQEMWRTHPRPRWRQLLRIMLLFD